MIANYILIAAFLISGCDWGPWKKDNKPAENLFAERLALLQEKRDRYCEHSKEEWNALGFVGTKCDSLLFSALHGVGCDYIDLAEFEDPAKPGKWYRSPQRDCFIPPSTDNGAKSTISKDMYTGLLHYMWSRQDKAMVDRTIKYGEDNKWVVGEAIDIQTLLGRAVMTPALYNRLYDMQAKFGAVDAAKFGAAEIFPRVTGFQAHLEVLGVLHTGRVHGAISDIDKKSLASQAKRMPRNALFGAANALYTDGNMNAAVELLLDESFFPSDRLPDGTNYCTDYLYQRDDEPKDWGPCPGGFKSGTDLIFVTSVIEGFK